MTRPVAPKRRTASSSSASDAAPVRRTPAGTLMPFACQMHLVISLSIAMAEAATPGPV